MNKKLKTTVVSFGIILTIGLVAFGIFSSNQLSKSFASEKGGLNYMYSQWKVLMNSTNVTWDTSWNATIRSTPSNDVARHKLEMSLCDLQKTEKDLHVLFEKHYWEFSPHNQVILKKILDTSLLSVHGRQEAIKTVLNIQDETIYLSDVLKKNSTVNLQADYYLNTTSQQWEALEPSIDS